MNYGYCHICIIMNIWSYEVQPWQHFPIEDHSIDQVVLNKIFLLQIFLVCEQNVVKVFSFGPYHQLSSPNIYLDYHNTSFDACTTFFLSLGCCSQCS